MAQPDVGLQLVARVRAYDAAQDCVTFAFTVMPDHVHWVFRLGARLSLGQVIARFKSQSRRILSLGKNRWQRNYFEHRLRTNEPPEDYALYVFLNPYRAELIPPTTTWPYWWCADPARLRFHGSLDFRGCPPGEWLDLPIPSGLKGAG